MTEPDWKLITIVSIPIGLIAGWFSNKSSNKILIFFFILIALALAGTISYSISKTHKRTNTFNSAVLSVIVIILYYIMKRLF